MQTTNNVLHQSVSYEPSENYIYWVNQAVAAYEDKQTGSNVDEQLPLRNFNPQDAKSDRNILCTDHA